MKKTLKNKTRRRSRRQRRSQYSRRKVLGGVDNIKTSNNNQRFNKLTKFLGMFKKAETTKSSFTQNQTQLVTQKPTALTTQNPTPLATTQNPTPLVGNNNQTPEEAGFIDKDPIPTNIKFYKIFGLGCDVRIERNIQTASSYNNAKVLKFEQKKIAELVKCNTDDVTIVCNSFIDPISNIISLWASNTLTYGLLSKNLNNLEKTNEFQNLLNSVTFNLNNDSVYNGIKRVYVHGDSFGGAMANQLAIVLQNKANLDKDFMQKMKSKLVIRTFGSIFIPPFNSIKDVNITNYLALNDVAQRLNFQTEPKHEEITEKYNIGTVEYRYNIGTVEYIDYTGANFFIKIKSKDNNDSVVWIDHYTDDNYKTRGIQEAFSKNAPYQKRGWVINIAGNNYEWRIHTAYTELEKKLISKETPVYLT